MKHLVFQSSIMLLLAACGGRENPKTAAISEPPVPTAPAIDIDAELADLADSETTAPEETPPPAPVSEDIPIPPPPPEETQVDVVHAPTEANPFDNPEMFNKDNAAEATPAEEPFDPARPMKVPLDFHAPNDIPPYPAPRPAQYKQWRQKGRIVVGHSHLDQVSFSPDAAYIMAMSENEGTVRIYDAKSLKMINNYSVLGNTSFSSFDALFWPVAEQEPIILFAKANGLMLYRALQGEPLSYLYPDPTSEIRWSDDRQTLVAFGYRKDAKKTFLSFYRRKSPAGLELIRAIPTDIHIYEVDISRDNRFLAVADADNVHLFSLETGEKIWTTPGPEYLWSVDLSPDGTKVAFGGDHVVIVDVQNPSRRTEYFKFNNNINRVRFSPSGDAVFVSSYDGHIRVVDPDLSRPTTQLLTTLRHGGTANVYEMDFTRDGNRMVSVSGDKTVRIWGGK